MRARIQPQGASSLRGQSEPSLGSRAIKGQDLSALKLREGMAGTDHGVPQWGDQVQVLRDMGSLLLSSILPVHPPWPPCCPLEYVQHAVTSGACTGVPSDLNTSTHPTSTQYPPFLPPSQVQIIIMLPSREAFSDHLWKLQSSTQSPLLYSMPFFPHRTYHLIICFFCVCPLHLNISSIRAGVFVVFITRS